MPVVLMAVAVLAGAGYVGWGLGTEFVPRLSEGDVVMGVVRAQGTSLEESVHVNMQMERVLLEAFPDEIERVWSRLGSPEVATEAGNLEATDMFISLKPRSQWRRATRQMDLVKQMLAEVEEIPGQIIWFTQPIEQRINETVSGVRADVALKLFADDFDQLISKSRELEEVLRKIEGAADVTTEQIAGQPILRIRVKQDQLARYGIPARLVMDLVESVGGKYLGEVVEGQLRFPLVIRLPEHLRNDVARIGDLMVAGPAGEQIPLSRLADVERISGPKLIARMGATADHGAVQRARSGHRQFRGRGSRENCPDGKSAAGQVSHRVGRAIRKHAAAQNRLMIVVPFALLMIVAILFLIYRNLTDTLLVFACVPFGCVGGIVALELRNMPLSMAAAVGFITLSGVSVLNSMVVVSLLREKLAEGMERMAAIEHAALTSLRTVLMTSLVASVGFIPMAASSSAGAEVQQPLATVVIGGVLSSALMTLLVLPALYGVVGKRIGAVGGGESGNANLR